MSSTVQVQFCMRSRKYNRTTSTIFSDKLLHSALMQALPKNDLPHRQDFFLHTPLSFLVPSSSDVTAIPVSYKIHTSSVVCSFTSAIKHNPKSLSVSGRVSCNMASRWTTGTDAATCLAICACVAASGAGVRWCAVSSSFRCTRFQCGHALFHICAVALWVVTMLSCCCFLIVDSLPKVVSRVFVLVIRTLSFPLLSFLLPFLFLPFPLPMVKESTSIGSLFCLRRLLEQPRVDDRRHQDLLWIRRLCSDSRTRRLHSRESRVNSLFFAAKSCSCTYNPSMIADDQDNTTRAKEDKARSHWPSSATKLRCHPSFETRSTQCHAMPDCCVSGQVRDDSFQSWTRRYSQQVSMCDRDVSDGCCAEYKEKQRKTRRWKKQLQMRSETIETILPLLDPTPPSHETHFLFQCVNARARHRTTEVEHTRNTRRAPRQEQKRSARNCMECKIETTPRQPSVTLLRTKRGQKVGGYKTCVLRSESPMAHDAKSSVPTHQPTNCLVFVSHRYTPFLPKTITKRKICNNEKNKRLKNFH